MTRLALHSGIPVSAWLAEEPATLATALIAVADDTARAHG